MPERNKDQTKGRWNPEESGETRRRQPTETTRNFEQSISDINTDPDAGFDFDLNPTDDRDSRNSDR